MSGNTSLAALELPSCLTKAPTDSRDIAGRVVLVHPTCLGQNPPKGGTAFQVLIGPGTTFVATKQYGRSATGATQRVERTFNNPSGAGALEVSSADLDSLFGAEGGVSQVNFRPAASADDSGAAPAAGNWLRGNWRSTRPSPPAPACTFAGPKALAGVRYHGRMVGGVMLSPADGASRALLKAAQTRKGMAVRLTNFRSAKAASDPSRAADAPQIEALNAKKPVITLKGAKPGSAGMTWLLYEEDLMFPQHCLVDVDCPPPPSA
jgi:hypothetical protein